MTERFMVRTTPDDLERWEDAARAAGLHVSPWLRTLANREVSRLAKRDAA